VEVVVAAELWHSLLEVEAELLHDPRERRDMKGNDVVQAEEVVEVSMRNAF
jgi:hypothetical protein